MNFNSLWLTAKEVNAYGKGKPLYVIHIKNLEIFDRPKALGEFTRYGSEIRTIKDLENITLSSEEVEKYVNQRRLANAPKNYIFVEEK